jgi:hypothetical protein
MQELSGIQAEDLISMKGVRLHFRGLDLKWAELVTGPGRSIKARLDYSEIL